MSSATATATAMAIPAGSRKVIQSLKEIVNCPEHEIYAMLKECNMDPNDTVHRLLSQDTFRQVKSKRERKKEVKETPESRPRGVSSGSIRGVKSGGSEFTVGRPGQTLISTSEPGKPSYKRENGSVAPPLLSSTSRIAAKPMNQLPQSYMSHSGSLSATDKGQSIGDALCLSALPSPGSQPSWSGAQGHVSMADIVRMGKPQGKASSTPIMSTETTYLPYGTVSSYSSSHSVIHPHEVSLSQNPICNVTEMISEPGATVGQHVHHEDWPVIEQSRAASTASDTEIYSYPSSSHSSRANLSYKGQPDELVQASEDVLVRNLSTDHNGSTTASSRQTVTESAWGASHLDSDSLKDMNSRHSQGYTFDRQEGIVGGSKLSVPNFSAPLIDQLNVAVSSTSANFSTPLIDQLNVAVSSTSANFEQLSLGNEDLKVPPVDDTHAVVIPNHLQVSAADCSHLSFGTFKSGDGLEFSGSLSSNPIKSDLEEFTSAAIDGSSASHLDTRTLEYHGNEQQLRSMSDPHRVNGDHRVNVDRQAYDPTITSQSEWMKPVTPESTQLRQDVFPSSLPGYDIEKRQQLRSTLPYAQSNQHNMDLSTFPSGMGLKSGSFSVPQPSSGTGIATGPTFPQNFTMHSYSQPSLPMGHSANMSGYSILPQSYGYLPSAIQQAYPGSSSLQSLAALESAGLKYTLPQYRSNASVSGLPQSAVNASGYGNFGSSNHAGSFLQKPSATPTYDDILSSLYKDGNQYRSLQQNESSATSGYGSGSRTLSSVPGSMYYDLQGQNQQLAGYRQGQQSMQHYGGLEYSNYLQPQSGITQDQRQSAGDLTSNGSIQGPSSKQSQQFWQHSY